MTSLLGRRSALLIFAFVMAAAGPASAVTFVDATSAHNAGSTSLTIAAPPLAGTGGLLLAQISFEKGSDLAVTPPAGWDLVVRTDHLTDFGQAVYRRQSGAGEPDSYAWSFSQSAKAAGIVMFYTGVDPTWPIGSYRAASGADGTLTAPSLTAEANSTLVAMFAVKKTTTLSSPGDGMTTRIGHSSPNDLTLLARDEHRSAAGPTGDRSSVPAEQSKWVAHLISLRSGGDGGGGSVDPGHADTLIEAIDAQAVANGVDTGSVRATLVDATGTPVANVAVGLSVTGSAALTTPAGTTDASGQFASTLTSTVAEIVDVTALYDSDDDGTPDTAIVNGSPAQVEFVAGPVDPTPDPDPDEVSTNIAAIDDAAAADGADTGLVRVTLVDAFDNPVPGVTVGFASDSASAVLDSPTGVSDAAGQVSTTLRNTVAETVSVTAMYDSDGEGTPDSAIVQGSPAMVAFVEATTSTEITGHAPDPSVVGEPYTVTVTVTASHGAAAGTAMVSDGVGGSCNATVSAGSGGCDLASGAAGTVTLTASFAGAAGYGDSVSAGVDHTVNQAATTLALSGLPGTITEGDSVDFTWGVTVDAPGAGTPGGSVTVSETGGLNCTAAVSAGGCSITIAMAGNYDFNGSYSGDANFLGDDDGPVQVDVQSGGTPQADITVRHEIVRSGLLSDGTGSLVDYELEVGNLGPSDDDVDVDMLMPPEFTDISWTCAPSGSASCGTPSGTGDIALTATIPSGDSVLITLEVRIVDPENSGVATAAMASPATVSEIDPSDNSATTFYRQCNASEIIGARPLPQHVCTFRDGFEQFD
ncbi:MAG TPA: Ig-like domain-containing protein [Xanthomonadaceae bacterium]|nr:Ig-like domain-containing protein [Xanthomonadaceae bacterium]